MKIRARFARSLRSTWYLVAGLRTALPALLGVCLLPLALLLAFGVPGLPWVAGRIRALTNVERRRAAKVLGQPILEPATPQAINPYQQYFSLMRSTAVWRDIGWMFVHGFVGLIVTVFSVEMWLTIPWNLALPFWWWTQPPGTLGAILQIYTWPQAIAYPVGSAALFIVIQLFLQPWLARFEGWYAQRLLGPTRRTELAARVESLTETRAEALEAHGAELRRIERDLHDGTQAQLVSAALRLGLADQRFDADPGGARKLMLDARTGIEDALAELRDVIRGIHPPILSDRGLAGAVRALAAGRPVPVSVEIPEPDRRCPAAVEAAAYFVVAEALTNVAKHSGAAHAWVSVRHDGPYLTVRVRDDGRGGADPAGGSGLAGIRRRVAALDGVTRIDSRTDGTGTTVEVELPCGL
ncbi:histidine kinase [Catenulispora acidiphila DSM 44928]|uniref:histidine kinase n=1 Tax=Catenulispora acidiphila (strain DSM 44928 / JCM 14897 / NBRC 102108 / NRRL B-24433 / ID139908) TaxID=479433 RepID=C7PW71_CATAD|nr:sensor histidine kinase [Catenulispora acidiphila]ACU73319.1 histidine kinase [Catenulispora acidiphila DSM 44928]